MQITDVRINGMKQPMGYAFSAVKVSWKVTDAIDKKQKEAQVVIAYDEKMTQIVTSKKGNLRGISQIMEFERTPRTTYYVIVSVIGEGGEKAISEVTSFDTGKMSECWEANWIGMQPEDKFHPIFEKVFTLKEKITRARLYICGVGLYEAYLDGKKIGTDYLAPFFNDYNCALQSQTYDVTDGLKAKNTLSVMLGNGWYKGRLGYDGKEEVYGNQFACIAELHVEYADGTKDLVITDSSWYYYSSGILYSDIYDGEGIDRNQPAKEKRPTVLLQMDTKKLTDRYSMPLHEMEDMPVKEIIKTPLGETVLDFGQNFSGYVTFQSKQPKGNKVVLTHGEVLQNGNFYHDNYRTAKTEFTYLSDGVPERVRPHFTYTGFRYVKVEGWIGDLCKEDFTGKAVYSAMEQTGQLTTGHEKVNQLISNALWGLKGNFLDMPTDCPQRDERLGWTGDAQVFAPTASFFMDTRAFYRKFLWDMRNDQVLRGGAIANYLPNINGETGGSSVWGDAATFIPSTLYETYGDKEALEEAYPCMKDWVEWIRRGDEARAGGPTYQFDFAFSFGDWLAMDGVTPQSFKGGTEDAYVSSIYYYASVKKLEEAARVLDKREDEKQYKELAENVKEAILQEYFTPVGRLAIDTQTGYIIALYFKVYRDKQCLIKGLQNRLKKDGYRIQCGFVGAPLICETLSSNGMKDLAYHIFLQEKFPSWLHCVNLGATTIWERWNSILDDGSISGTGMNSLNHYAYGSVIHYVVKQIAGLQPLEAGYSKVKIAPDFNAKLGFLKCSYDSVSGNYVIHWNILPNGNINVHIEVPFNCEAVVELPGYDKKELLLESGITDITYQPIKDYRNLYHWDTLLEDYVQDERAMKILQENLPIAYAMAQTDDLENLGLTLGEMRYMPWFGFAVQDVEKTAAKIFTLQIM